jgi:hypothetical protein
MSLHAHAQKARRFPAILRVRTIFVVSLLALSSMAIAPCAGATDTNASPSSLRSVFSSASGGDVIHLAAGDYGTFSGGSKGSPVTLVAAPGTTVTMSVQLAGNQNVVLDGVTITDAYLNEVHNVTIRNSVFRGMTRVDAATGNAGLLFDHDTFAGISPCPTCYEGRLTIKGNNNSDGVTPAGVTITNNVFGPGGTADGVQIIGAPFGVRVGPGNEFTGLAQSSAANAPHTDALQLYGSTHTVITGNWMHDNATGIMAPDGSYNETITDNVIQTTGYPWPMVMGGAQNDVIQHNTLPGSAGVIELDKSNAGNAAAGNVVKDNVLTNVTSASGGTPSGVTQDYNLLSAGTRGAHDIKGRPTYGGGSSPNTFAGFALSGSSTGAGKASDGTNMGIDPGAGPSSGGGAGAGGGSGAGTGTGGSSSASTTAPGGTASAGAAGSALSAALRAPLPTLRLAGVKAGQRFSRSLAFRLTTGAGAAIDHVGVWLDDRWLKTLRNAPYALAWRAPRNTRTGFHTLTARLFAGDGRVSSISVTVRRVGSRTRAASAAHAITMRTTPSSTGATILRGQAKRGRRVKVALAGCRDPRAAIAQELTLKATDKGELFGAAPGANLCVVALRLA